jgi:hypothetical protein
MRSRSVLASAVFFLLVAAACSVEILVPDYHRWDVYQGHSDHGYSDCGACHTVIRVRTHDSGCWQCH